MYTPGAGTAEVQFVRAEDCAAYFDATPNGIRYPGEPERFITVEKCVPEPSHDIVKSYIDRGVTRCVRVQNVDSDWTRKALAKLATGNGSSRRIAERIVNGQNTAGVCSASYLLRIPLLKSPFSNVLLTSASSRSLMLSHSRASWIVSHVCVLL